MTLQELELAVAKLPTQELQAFTTWFEDFLADAWDERIEADIKSGKLDAAGKRADEDFKAGNCKPL